MSKKKILVAVLALALVCAMSIAGTLAFLTKKADKKTVNTFAMSDVFPVDPEHPENEPFFKLDESLAESNGDGTYRLASSEKPRVNENHYDEVLPATVQPKDPKVTSSKTGMATYLFIAVKNEVGSNISYKISSVWTPIAEKDNVTIYCYGDGKEPIKKGEAYDYYILEGNQVTVDSEITKAGDLGALSFEAYAIQAQGANNAAEAWTNLAATPFAD